MKKMFLILVLLFLVSGCVQETPEPVPENLQETDYEPQVPEEHGQEIVPEDFDDGATDLDLGIIEDPEERPLVETEDVVFIQHMFELDKAEHITPLGELEGGWEEMEVVNMALVHIKRPGGHGTASERMEIYAPTEMSLESYSYSSFGDYDPNWTLIFEINSDLTLRLSALTDVSDKIKEAVGTEFTRGEINLQTPLEFGAGELVAYTGGNVQIHNWDILLYDKTHNNEFVNQARYEVNYMGERYRNAVCPFKFYPEEMQQEYIALYGFSSAGTTGDCGNASRDVGGTLSGAWFLSEDISEGIRKEEKGNFTSPLFIYSNSDGGTSLGFVNKKRYKILKENSTNKDPAEVTEEHCYELINAYDRSVDGFAFFKIVSDMEMQLAYGSTSCPNSFPTEFESYYR